MKKPSFTRPAQLLLISGLLLLTGIPMLSRYYPMPDALKGFLTGIGLSLEFLSLVWNRQNKFAKRRSEDAVQVKP